MFASESVDEQRRLDAIRSRHNLNVPHQRVMDTRYSTDSLPRSQLIPDIFTPPILVFPSSCPKEKCSALVLTVSTEISTRFDNLLI